MQHRHCIVAHSLQMKILTLSHHPLATYPPPSPPPPSSSSLFVCLLLLFTLNHSILQAKLLTALKLWEGFKMLQPPTHTHIHPSIVIGHIQIVIPSANR